MPPGWTPKDERQKRHVEASELAAGKPAQDALRIAFATTNKERGRRQKVEAAKALVERARR